MRIATLVALVAALALGTTACGRFGAKGKAGYAVGLSIGKSMISIQDKVDIPQVQAGIQDELAGKSTMQDDELRQVLMGLQQGNVPDKSKTGYAVGVSIGRNVKPVADLVGISRLMDGIKDQLAGKPGMDEATMRAVLGDLGQRQQAAQAKDNEGRSAKNKKDGADYLAKNGAKAGVKTTASGLQYEVITEGKGPHPKATDTVKVDYVGTLIDGTKFDSSIDRGQPATFPLNGVIPGWTEGVQLMSVGSKYRFTIPSTLAYGPNGPGKIGPDAVLVFEVSLLGIEKAKK